MDRIGVILCAGEEKFFVSLMMWLQSHHDVSCVKMISYRDVIDILADETDTPAHDLLRARLEDLAARTGVSLIVVVDSRSGIHDRGERIKSRERLSAARRRA